MPHVPASEGIFRERLACEVVAFCAQNTTIVFLPHPIPVLATTHVP